MDEIEQIEAALAEGFEALSGGDWDEDDEASNAYQAATRAVMAALEGHRPIGKPRACGKCARETSEFGWPCEPVVKVMDQLRIGQDTTPASIGDPNLPPLVNSLSAKLKTALDNGYTDELFGALRYLLDQHLPNEQGGCPVCGMLWPCWTIRSLSSSFMIGLTPANIGAEAWARTAPEMKTPQQLAEGIRHALQAVADAGYRVWMNDDGNALGILQSEKPVSLAQVSFSGPGGEWQVYSWQVAE
jgi:hypothetical protein